MARVDVSINKFFGSFLYLDLLKKNCILPFFNKNKYFFLLCKVFFICFAKFELTRAIGRGPSCDIFQWSTKQTLLDQQILSQRQTDQFICWFLLQNVKSSFFLPMQKLSKDEKVPTSGNTNLPPCQLNLHHCYMQIACVNTATLSYGRRLNDKTSDHFAFRRIDNISSIMKSPTEIHSDSAIELQVYHK